MPRANSKGLEVYDLVSNKVIASFPEAVEVRAEGYAYRLVDSEGAVVGIVSMDINRVIRCITEVVHAASA